MDVCLGKCLVFPEGMVLPITYKASSPSRFIACLFFVFRPMLWIPKNIVGHILSWDKSTTELMGQAARISKNFFTEV